MDCETLALHYDSLSAEQASRLKTVAVPYGLMLCDPSRNLLDAIHDFPSLQYLSLRFDNCPDWLPVSLASFRHLFYLELRFGETANCPARLLNSLSGLDSLVHLVLRGVNIGAQEETDPFFRLPLQSICLAHCDGLGMVLNEKLASMPVLRSVEIVNTPISARSTRAIAACPSVDAVRLRGCELRKGTLSTLGGLKGLRSLDLEDVVADPADMGSLAGFRGLSRLSLRSTKIDDAFLETLPGAQLRTLFLSGDTITDRCVGSLIRMKQLDHLDLSCTAVGDSCVVPLITQLSLSRLGLSGTRVSDRIVSSLLDFPIAAVDVSETKVSLAGLLRLAASPGIAELGYSAATAPGPDAERIRKARPPLRIVVSD
jgi:hypothetical protein